jgi:hypothetical protein
MEKEENLKNKSPEEELTKDESDLEEELLEEEDEKIAESKENKDKTGKQESKKNKSEVSYLEEGLLQREIVPLGKPSKVKKKKEDDLIKDKLKSLNESSFPFPDRNLQSTKNSQEAYSSSNEGLEPASPILKEISGAPGIEIIAQEALISVDSGKESKTGYSIKGDSKYKEANYSVSGGDLKKYQEMYDTLHPHTPARINLETIGREKPSMLRGVSSTLPQEMVKDSREDYMPKAAQRMEMESLGKEKENLRGVQTEMHYDIK